MNDDAQRSYYTYNGGSALCSLHCLMQQKHLIEWNKSYCNDVENVDQRVKKVQKCLFLTHANLSQRQISLTVTGDQKIIEYRI